MRTLGNKNQWIPQFRSGVETKHEHIGNRNHRNQRIPQFRYSVETEHAHIRNRNQRIPKFR
jgi:hypothetical protein